jgi:DNA polymerase III gamma/tau subunit
MAGNFFIETITKLGKCNEAEAKELLEVIDTQALVQSWSNGTNRDFKIAINYARMYINNGYSWE